MIIYFVITKILKILPHIEKNTILQRFKICLGGFIKSQSQINEFIKKCRSLENKEGFLSPNFYQLQLNNNYKFVSGPFAENIFKIVSLQKNKIDILMGNIKTTIKEGSKFLFNPA